jgi:hypothetical protein
MTLTERGLYIATIIVLALAVVVLASAVARLLDRCVCEYALT